MPYTQYSTDEIVERGEAWYDQLRPQVESAHKGRYMVIDIETGDYEIGDDYGTLSDNLHTKRPDAPLYALRIGYPVLGRIGSQMLEEAA
jgi:hypothetical protein